MVILQSRDHVITISLEEANTGTRWLACGYVYDLRMSIYSLWRWCSLVRRMVRHYSLLLGKETAVEVVP